MDKNKNKSNCSRNPPASKNRRPHTHWKAPSVGEEEEVYTLLLEMENAIAMGWVLPDTPAGTQVQLSTPTLGSSQPPGT